MVESLVFGLLITISIAMFFFGIWRMIPRADPVDARLSSYGSTFMDDSATGKRRRLPVMNRLVNGFGLANRLADAMGRADIPLTATEYSLIILGLIIVGVVAGTMRLNLFAGMVLGVLLGSLPIAYIRVAESRRRRAINNQLPDVLTLLVGSLKAGYGLNQAIEVLVEQLPSPSSVEFSRVTHAVNLGVPVQRALQDMAARVGTDDMDLIVTAITVQYEMGGNLAAVLDSIAETIRERIRIQREVRTLTAQQRLTGLILALLPVLLVVTLSLLNPGYYDPLLEPGMIRLVPLSAIVLVIIGFILMQRILDIEV